MILDWILYLTVGYIAIVIIWRIIATVVMCVSGYAENGIPGAVIALIVTTLIHIWDAAKFAFWLVILIIILKLILHV